MTRPRWGMHSVAAELRWQNTLLPYQMWPCLRCGSHESWREWSGSDGNGQYSKPRSQWGCQCPTSAGGDWGWDLWVFLSGRGTGKTLTGSNFALRQALEQPGTIGGVIAPTHSDLRRILLEGETGLLRMIPRELIQLTKDDKVWNQAASAITLKNGSVIRTLAAEKPDRIRGENLAWVWADELAAWTRLDYAWEQLEMATRVGVPRYLITTTPRPLPLLKALLRQEGTVSTSATSYDNPHLAAIMRRRIERYRGTRMGRQEIMGEILEDVEGALWDWPMIEDARALGILLADLRRLRTVTAIDPSGGGASEAGIITAARYGGDQAGILADDTLLGTAAQWAGKGITAMDTWGSDRIVGETNFGGDMVEETLRAVDRSAPFKKVTASRGKRQRAEPVAALFEKRTVGLLGSFPELEHEMTNWVPDTGMASPNRMDAMVWALTELMLGEGTRQINPDHLKVGPEGIGKMSPWRSAPG